LLVDPSGTFPKVTAVGLTLNVPEGVVELPLVVVNPLHPD
jgi:hypothetical protein